MKITKYAITNKEPMTIWLGDYDKKRFEQQHLVRADKIEYIANKDENYFDHHVMFYLGEELIFKIWLSNKPTDKPYKNIKESLKGVNIEIV